MSSWRFVCKGVTATLQIVLGRCNVKCAYGYVDILLPLSRAILTSSLFEDLLTCELFVRSSV